MFLPVYAVVLLALAAWGFRVEIQLSIIIQELFDFGTMKLFRQEMDVH